MSTLRAELADLLAYTDWADHRMFVDLIDLDDDEWVEEVGGSFGTIQGTAAHIVSSEWVWLERWQGRSPGRAPEWILDPDARELSDRWTGIAGARRTWLHGLSEQELTADLTYRRLAGEEHTDPLPTLVRHVVNHSSYHRGQVAAFLRNVGRAPTSSDLVLWARMRRENGPSGSL